MRHSFGAALFLWLFAASPAPAQTWFGPSPYTSAADSPFAAEIASGDVVVEDFEDGSLDLPGVATNGTVGAPGEFSDSVDADDGSIDGFGNDGRSLFFSPGSQGVAFDFDPLVAGGLPTEVGVVWTDGLGTVSFEAFDENGVSLGVQGPFDFPDAAITGETGEDRFLGLTYAGGVSRIVVSNTEGGIEVDHLQIDAPEAAACEAGPRPDCSDAAPRGAKLVLSDRKEALKWKWSGAAGATQKSDFGAPTSSTGYTLCLHDASAGIPVLVLQARIPPGEGWKESSRGFSYKRKDGGPDGVQKLQLKAPAAGSTKPAKIRLAGKDMALPAQPLSQSPEVAAQLVSDDGVCFEARFSSPAAKNDEKAFKDSSD